MSAPLFLLPGLDGTGRLFRPLLAALPAGLHAKVVAYPVDQPLDLPQLAAHVLRQLPAEKVVLLAESFSGLVALTLLANAAARVRAVIFAGAFAEPPRPFLLRVAPVFSRAGSLARSTPSFLLRRYCLGSHATAAELNELRGAIAAVSPEIVAQRLALIGKPHAFKVPSDIPVGYLRASDDRLVPASCAEWFRQRFKACEVKEIPGPHFLLQANPHACATEGRVVWSPAKSIWNTAMLGAALTLGPITATVDAVLLFAVLTYATLLVGHSVGMHRFLIHRTYDCAPWLGRLMVYIGVLVGMAGPYGVLRVHDIRDWAQRLPACHDFFSHRRALWIDALWQLHCRFEFTRAPLFRIEPDLLGDPWLRWMERTWMLQQIPLAALLYALGGWPWVVWGICCRVSVSVAGHWIVTYFCHNPGPGQWHVRSAGVQATDLHGLGLITMGECWHNNHHAFPESARMGLEPGQTDPGFWVIRQMERLGLVWNVGHPRDAAERDDLEIIPASRARASATP